MAEDEKKGYLYDFDGINKRMDELEKKLETLISRYYKDTPDHWKNVHKPLNEKIEKLEKKPCMQIERVLTDKEIDDITDVKNRVDHHIRKYDKELSELKSECIKVSISYDKDIKELRNQIHNNSVADLNHYGELKRGFENHEKRLARNWKKTLWIKKEIKSLKEGREMDAKDLEKWAHERHHEYKSLKEQMDHTRMNLRSRIVHINKNIEWTRNIDNTVRELISALSVKKVVSNDFATHLRDKLTGGDAGSARQTEVIHKALVKEDGSMTFIEGFEKEPPEDFDLGTFNDLAFKLAMPEAFKLAMSKASHMEDFPALYDKNTKTTVTHTYDFDRWKLVLTADLSKKRIVPLITKILSKESMDDYCTCELMAEQIYEKLGLEKYLRGEDK